MGVFLTGESGGVDLVEHGGDIGGNGDIEVLVHEDTTSSLKSKSVMLVSKQTKGKEYCPTKMKKGQRY